MNKNSRFAIHQIFYWNLAQSYSKVKEFVDGLNGIENLQLKKVFLNKQPHKEMIKEGYREKLRFSLKYKFLHPQNWLR